MWGASAQIVGNTECHVKISYFLYVFLLLFDQKNAGLTLQHHLVLIS